MLAAAYFIMAHGIARLGKHLLNFLIDCDKILKALGEKNSRKTTEIEKFGREKFVRLTKPLVKWSQLIIKYSYI